MSNAGRPSLASPELMQEICDKLSQGQSLRSICREESMPCKATVLRWADADEDFATKYGRAREAGVEVHVDEMIEIADDLRIPPDQKRHMLGTRQWIASKLIAKKYGDRIELEHSGSIEKKPDDWLESRIAELAAKAGIVGIAGRAGEAPEEA